MRQDMDIDLAELASLVTLLKEADFSEFRYDKGDVHIVVRRGGEGGVPLAPAPEAVPAASGDTARRGPLPEVERSVPASALRQAEPVAGATTVTAPMLGTFYSAPKPGEPPFVQVGSRVEPDSVLCIIEVMKLMNSVNAEISGEVVAVHVRDGELVEFGQPLFSIRKAEKS